MIWESGYWKVDLLRRSADLQRRMKQKRWPDVSLVRIEQSLMLGFYSIRNLREAKKLTDAVARRQVSFTSYPRRENKRVHHFNWHKLEDLYDFNASYEDSRDLGFLCNQVIHSYIFSPVFSDAGYLDGILLASDRERRQRVISVAMREVVSIFAAVGNDDVETSSASWDEKNGDYRFTNS